MIAAYTLGALYALWVLFLAVMNLDRANQAGTLGNFALFLGFPLFLVAWALDVAINQTVGTVLFLDVPREWTLSERLERLKVSTDWRGAWADVVLRRLLAPFDTSGRHSAR
jgi:hypothetical protein